MVYYINLATGGYAQKSTLVEARATAIKSMSGNGSRASVPIISSTKGMVGEVVKAPRVASGYVWVAFPMGKTQYQPLYKNGRIAKRRL